MRALWQAVGALLPLIRGVVCAVIIALGLVVIVDPFGFKARQKIKTQLRLEAGAMQADLRQRERVAQAEIAASQGRLQQKQISIAAQTHAASEQARKQDDGKTSMGNDRRHRLGQHDASLCKEAGRYEGCAR